MNRLGHQKHKKKTIKQYTKSKALKVQNRLLEWEKYFKQANLSTEDMDKFEEKK